MYILFQKSHHKKGSCLMWSNRPLFIHKRKLPNYVEPALESHFHTLDHKNTILSRRMSVPRETNVLPDDKGKMYLIYTNIAPLS